MARSLTSATTLDQLEKEAEAWLQDIKTSEEKGRARLRRAWPGAPAEPGLHDIKRALAREYGINDWNALNQFISQSPPEREHFEQTAEFLDHTCPDWRMGGGPFPVMHIHTAERILQAHPEIATENLFTRVVCGDLEGVERILRGRPAAAIDEGGPKQWPPLLYLCSARLGAPAFHQNSVAIARLLLDHGADPNSYYFGGSATIHYTALTTVVAQGEENLPLHPQAQALAALLLERGAEPYDMQVMYNAHFHGDMQWILELMYEHSIRRGRAADWEDPNWRMLDMGGYGSGARYLLTVALNHNNVALAEWILSHGASPNPPPAPGTKWWKAPQRSLYEEAVLYGLTDMAKLLARYGAKPLQQPLTGEDAFFAACFRLDHKAAKTLLQGNPEYLRSPAVMHAAAKRDRVDVVKLLLDPGMSADIADPRQGNQTPLHVAAYAGSARVARLLVERGAQIDPVDQVHDGTPLWFAVWGRRQNIIDVLSPLSHDLWALAATGSVQRMREVLKSGPNMARMSSETTPLFWLPDDETQALEVVELLLAHGADPGFRREWDSMTAADVARERRLLKAARRISEAAGTESTFAD